MSQRIRIFIIIAAVMYMALHIFTLNIAPLPWFDEVFFANVAYNYADHGKMESTIIPLYYRGEIYQYGPVYFAVQAVVIKIFGLSAVSFRFLNLLCGFGVVAVLYNIFKRDNDQSKLDNHQPIVGWLFGALILFDTVFNQNLHSGRMDLVATFFVACCLLYTYRFKNEQQNYQLVLIGLFAALAFLTTPRSVFLLTAPAVLFVIKPGKRLIPNSAIAIICFIVPVLLTIQFTFGLQNYIQGMTSKESATAASTFIGGSLLRETYENHVIILMIIICGIFYKRVLRSPLLISMLVAFSAFSLFVNESGPYSAMVIPFVYLVIVSLVKDADVKVRYGLIGLLLLINVGMFTLRVTTTLLSTKERNIDSEYYSKLETIPARSKILADYRFFYWSINHNNSFESYGQCKCTLEEYVTHMVSEYAPDYVLIRPGDETWPIFKSPGFQNSYELVEEIRIENKPSRKLEQIIRRFVSFDANFECTVYKRKS